MADGAEKRNVVLGISGSIAAYKSAELARLLVTRGYSVRVMITEAGAEFITPLTFQAITGNAVTTGFWNTEDPTNIGHIELADWADCVVVAPASADILAKINHGFAENPLLATILASKAQLLLAPAMNVNMFEHPATQGNIAALKARGVSFVEPGEGALACGWNGAGRMAEPAEIFLHIRRALSPQDFKGRRVLITSGPTREAIDPVRFISNRSSGKMGLALAEEAFRRGAEVTLIHGPMNVAVPKFMRTVPVTTALEMNAAVDSLTDSATEAPDVVIMAAAVADFSVKEISEVKIKRAKGLPKIELVPNPDILFELGKKRGSNSRPALVGFAVETGEIEDLILEARSKLETKNIDLIVGNFASEAFDLETNRVWLVDKHGRQEQIATTFKNRVANKILDAVLRL